jgi:ABC-type cobalamin/Fe3+-siderophores transport system ATPase subunit
VVLTTYDLNGVAAWLPHVVCLNRRLVAQGPPGGVLTPAVLEATYGVRPALLRHGDRRLIVGPLLSPPRAPAGPTAAGPAPAGGARARPTS